MSRSVQVKYMEEHGVKPSEAALVALIRGFGKAKNVESALVSPAISSSLGPGNERVSGVLMPWAVAGCV
jgi:hypothetical protein